MGGLFGGIVWSLSFVEGGSEIVVSGGLRLACGREIGRVARGGWFGECGCGSVVWEWCFGNCGLWRVVWEGDLGLCFCEGGLRKGSWEEGFIGWIFLSPQNFAAIFCVAFHNAAVSVSVPGRMHTFNFQFQAGIV